MRFAGFVLQICSLLVLIGGVLLTVATLSAPMFATANTWMTIMLGAVIGSATLYGLGGVFLLFNDMASDARRSADASERTAKSIELLVYRQRPKSEGAKVPETADTPQRSSTLQRLKRQ